MTATLKPAPLKLVPTPKAPKSATDSILPTPEPRLRPDYHLGAIYALVAAALLALQEPFSALAATSLKTWDFIGFTQVALLAAIPLMIARQEARRDFFAMLTTRALWPKFAVLLMIGLAGLAFYDLGMSGSHPIIAAAVLNLSPFWAALVGRVVAGSRLPGSPLLFFGCLAVAFSGATIIAWSQVNGDGSRMALDVLHGLMRGHWLFAIPMPIFFALSGALVFVWFREYDEGAAIAANFAVSAAVLIPVALIFAWTRGELGFHTGIRGGDLHAADRGAFIVRRRARVLSGGADLDEQRQRLRDNVLPHHPGAGRAGVVADVALDFGAALHSESDVLRRPRACHGAATAVRGSHLAQGSHSKAAASAAAGQISRDPRPLAAVSKARYCAAPDALSSSDLVSREADFAQHFIGVLTETRRGVIGMRIPAVNADRRAHRGGYAALGVL